MGCYLLFLLHNTEILITSGTCHVGKNKPIPLKMKQTHKISESQRELGYLQIMSSSLKSLDSLICNAQCRSYAMQSAHTYGSDNSIFQVVILDTRYDRSTFNFQLYYFHHL